MIAFKSTLAAGLFDLFVCAGVHGCGGASTAADGGLDATNEHVLSDANGDVAGDVLDELIVDGANADAPNCGTFTCDPATEYCQSVIYGSNQSPFYCVVADASSQLTCANDGCSSDAGMMHPGCDDAGNELGPCGCYKSPNSGLVTTTLCIP